MKKKLTLLIFLFPLLLMAQNTTIKNGTISIDLGKKKQQQDTVPPRSPYSSDDEDAAPKAKKERKQAAAEPKQQAPDYRKEGLFKALFTAGVSGCQIDGDGYGGYNYPGFEGGIGAMVRFHKFLSASLGIDYTMKGAKQAFVFDGGSQYLQLYRVEVDYIAIPVTLNVHAKDLIMVNAGLQPGFLTRFSERTSDGQDITNQVVQPNPVDLEVIGGLYFIIKKHYMLGGKFSYSLFKIRGPDSFSTGLSRLVGEYNNDITISFTYILDTVKKRKNIN